MWAALVEVVNDFGHGEVRFRSIEIARIVAGRIVEHWELAEDQAEIDRILTEAAEKAGRGRTG